MWEKRFNLTINAFLWKKMTVRKRAKKISNVWQHKNMCIPILKMYKKVCDILKLLSPFDWFYKPWSNWFCNIVQVMSFNKGSEIF